MSMFWTRETARSTSFPVSGAGSPELPSSFSSLTGSSWPNSSRALRTRKHSVHTFGSLYFQSVQTQVVNIDRRISLAIEKL